MKCTLHFWSNWLVATSVLFAIQSLSWIAIGSFDPFGIYDSLLADALFGADRLSSAEKHIFQFGAGLLGATSFSFFVMYAAVAHIPLRRGEKWAHSLLFLSIISWFVVDSAFSVAMSAYFNVFIVNTPCLLINLIPLLMVRGQLQSGSSG